MIKKINLKKIIVFEFGLMIIHILATGIVLGNQAVPLVSIFWLLIQCITYIVTYKLNKHTGTELQYMLLCMIVFTLCFHIPPLIEGFIEHMRRVSQGDAYSIAVTTIFVLFGLWVFYMRRSIHIFSLTRYSDILALLNTKAYQTPVLVTRILDRLTHPGSKLDAYSVFLDCFEHIPDHVVIYMTTLGRKSIKDIHFFEYNDTDTEAYRVFQLFTRIDTYCQRIGKYPDDVLQAYQRLFSLIIKESEGRKQNFIRLAKKSLRAYSGEGALAHLFSQLNQYSGDVMYEELHKASCMYKLRKQEFYDAVNRDIIEGNLASFQIEVSRASSLEMLGKSDPYLLDELLGNYIFPLKKIKKSYYEYDLLLIQRDASAFSTLYEYYDVMQNENAKKSLKSRLRDIKYLLNQVEREQYKHVDIIRDCFVDALDKDELRFQVRNYSL